MPRILDYLPDILHDYLYKNSMFLVLSRLLNAAVGSLFWILAAKYYSIAEVGKATVLISSLGLVMLFSRFGFDLSIIRYVMNSDKNIVFHTSLIITTFFSIFFGIIYIVFAGLFQDNLTVNFIYGLLFILVAFFNSIAFISGNMFLALRKGQNYFIQTLIISIRLFLLLPLAYLGDFGIFLSLGICYVLCVVFSLWVLRKEVKLNFFTLDTSFVKKSFKFSIGSYFSNILIEAPLLILPIMVLNSVGQKEAAIYYIAMAFGNLALIVPYALSTSLFVEGSHGQPLKQNVTKACTAAFLCLIPMALIIGLWGGNILELINKEYIKAYNLLLLVIFTSFFAVIYMVYISVQNIKMRVGRNIKFNLLRLILLLGASAFLLPGYGILGVGYAWLFTHIILTLMIAMNYVKISILKALGHSQIQNTKGSENTPDQN